MTKTHIIYIPFTGVGKHQYKGDDWFRDRIEIFKNYTLKSLLNQTNQNFILMVSFRQEDQLNPILSNFEGIEKVGFTEPWWTFTGLLYHDDKNEEIQFETILNREYFYMYAKVVQLMFD